MKTTRSPGHGLAASLRTWRARLAPAGVDPAGGRARRVAGLRREELAGQAGVSVDYVVRLEQGRAIAPSAQVVAALARVLRLTPFERDHLYRLAGLQAPPALAICDDLTPGVERLLARLRDVAVGVFAADWRLVWWTQTWAALLGDPAGIAPDDRNFVRVRFPTEARRAVVARWPVRVADPDGSDRAIVADLRRASARYPRDRRLGELLRETITGNAHFARLWEAGEVARHVQDRKTVEHPVVGDIAVDCDVVDAADADLRLVVLTTAPGSEAARRLALAGQPDG